MIKIQIKKEKDSLAVFLFFLTVFIFFQSFSVYGGDSGDLLAAAATGSFAHPPGYPLYSLLARILTFLPLLTLAWRVGLLSSLFSALSLTLLYKLLKKYFAWFIALSVVFFSAFLYPVFLYSEVAEVFSMTSFFVLWLLYLALQWRDKKNKKTQYLFFIILGLSMTHHHIVFFSFPVLYYLLADYLRKIKRQEIKKYLLAFFCSVTFIFSGFFIGQHAHQDIFQAGLLLPFLCLFYLKAVKNRKIKYWAAFAFILSQQIFTGNLQVPFISMVAILSHGAWLAFFTKQKRLENTMKIYLPLFISVLFAFMLSAIQVLPTWEYTSQSVRAAGLSYQEVTSYPFAIRDLVGLIYPFTFGNPANGSYPPLSISHGIFWENLFFPGFFIPFFSLFAFLNKKRAHQVKFIGFLLFFSLLLVLGKHSPLYFIYTFFPFMFFRVPSRFLLLSIFSLIFLSAYGLEFLERYMKKGRIYLLFALLVLNFSSQYYLIKSYLPTASLSQALSAPQTIQSLKPNADSKIYSLFSSEKWNEAFYQGWGSPEKFITLQEYLPANINLLWNLKSGQIHNSIPLKTNYMLTSLIESGIDRSGVEIFVKPNTVKLWQILGITGIISAYRITNPEAELVPMQTENYYTYQLKNSLPLFFLSGQPINASSPDELYSQLNSRWRADKQSVLLDQNTYDSLSIKNTDTDFTPGRFEYSNCSTFLQPCWQLQSHSNSPAILIFNSLLYPGWKAKVNDQNSTLFKANLIQTGVQIPEGKSTIKFYYQPFSFWLGLVLSFTAHLVLAVLLFPNPNRNLNTLRRTQDH